MSFGGYIAYAIYQPGPLTDGQEIWIKKGQSISSIAHDLQQNQIIGDIIAFKIMIGLKKVKIKAGEYEIPPRASIREIIDQLAQGKPLLRKISIPEGWTSREILASMDLSPFLSGEVGQVIPPEGSLLPETYYFERGEAKSALITRMKEAMRAKVDELWAARDPSLLLRDKNEWVTLASIVEKETSLPAERPRIAAVFYNRLRLGMKLQTDPTVIYALTRGKMKWERPLTRDDLNIDDPYNTYLHEGLPPGPIANPGEASLRAVLHPIKSDELYFVADGTGGHAFAKTLEEHNHNVAKWRKSQKLVNP